MGTDLIAVKDLNAVDLFKNRDQVEKLLGSIKSQVLSYVPDVTTVSGRKAIASLAFRVSTTKVILDDMGKGLIADLKKRTSQVDEVRKSIRDTLDALRDEVYSPLGKWKEAERKAAEAAAKELERIEAEKKAREAAELAARIAEIEAREVAVRKAEAELEAKEEAAKAAEEAKAKAEREAEERKQREERIRIEAEAKAKAAAEEAAKAAILDAQRKEAEARLAIEKAERDKVEAEKKAIADQLAAVARAEEKMLEEQKAKAAAEQLRLAAEKAEESRRIADVEHQEKIRAEALNSLLVNSSIAEYAAGVAIAAIADGKVKHVFIKY
ncbi:MAG: cell envelope biogenesis protein TolA [Parcubacteria group bacterium]